jgi:hypothetical protein
VPDNKDSACDSACVNVIPITESTSPSMQSTEVGTCKLVDIKEVENPLPTPKDDINLVEANKLHLDIKENTQYPNPNTCPLDTAASSQDTILLSTKQEEKEEMKTNCDEVLTDSEDSKGIQKSETMAKENVIACTVLEKSSSDQKEQVVIFKESSVSQSVHDVTDDNGEKLCPEDINTQNSTNTNTSASVVPSTCNVNHILPSKEDEQTKADVPRETDLENAKHQVIPIETQCISSAEQENSCEKLESPKFEDENPSVPREKILPSIENSVPNANLLDIVVSEKGEQDSENSDVANLNELENKSTGANLNTNHLQESHKLSLDEETDKAILPASDTSKKKTEDGHLSVPTTTDSLDNFSGPNLISTVEDSKVPSSICLLSQNDDLSERNDSNSSLEIFDVENSNSSEHKDSKPEHSHVPSDQRKVIELDLSQTRSQIDMHIHQENVYLSEI